MEMHQVRYFLAVCETLNFTRAAESCHVAQPSLTRAIQKLEEELGGPLFLRERGKILLTPLGERMRPFLEQTFSAAAAAKAEAESFGKVQKTTLTFGVMCTIGPSRLVGLMNTLHDRLPNLEVRLCESSGDQMVDALLSGSVELALVGLPKYPSKLRVDPLYTERYVVAFPPGHRFEKMPVVPVSDMEGEVYLRRINCEYPEHFAEAAGDWTCALDVRYESEREDWIQAMVLSGMGCSILPEYAPLFPGLRTRMLVEPEIRREIAIATVPGRRFSPAVDAFVRLLRGHNWKLAA